MTTPDQPEKPRKYPPPPPMSPQQPPPNYPHQPTYSAPPSQPQPMYSPPPQQPWAPPSQPSTGMPQTYLVLNIVALLFSCLFGAIGLFFSNQVTQKWNAGDHEGARKASTTAMIMGIIGIALGGVVLIATLASGGY